MPVERVATMFKRFVPLAALLGLGGWYVYTHYDIRGLDFLEGTSDARPTAAGAAEGEARLPPPDRERQTIRIASFNAGPLDRSKLANRLVAGHLVRTIRQFDAIGLQDIRADGPALLGELLEQVNADGRHYAMASTPSRARVRGEPMCAVLFDKAVLQIDPSTVCLVEDPAGRLRHRPLVAAFRARGPEPSTAFTFTLINAWTSPDRAAQELDFMDDVFRAVRDDGRNEDDIILLGSLYADARRLEHWYHYLNLAAAINSTPTTTRGTHVADNLVFDRRATIEYTGRAEVFDLMAELELTAEQALEVSEHRPVWAEFSVYEGGPESRFAGAIIPAH